MAFEGKQGQQRGSGMGLKLRALRISNNWTLQQLSERSGVDVGTISAIEQRDSSRSQFFPALAKAFGTTVEELSMMELHFLPAHGEVGPPTYAVLVTPDEHRKLHVQGGSGEIHPFLGRPQQYPTMQPILAWQHEDELPPGEYVLVPRLDVHLSAGEGRGTSQVEIAFDEAQPQAFRADWVRSQHLKPKKLAAMIARGDSMEPGIFDGDSLLVDTSQTDVKDKKVYALWYDGGERVKRLFRLPGGGLRIKSDNPEYDTIELGPDHVGSVRIIGRVVHRSGVGGL